MAEIDNDNRNNNKVIDALWRFVNRAGVPSFCFTSITWIVTLILYIANDNLTVYMQIVLCSFIGLVVVVFLLFLLSSLPIVKEFYSVDKAIAESITELKSNSLTTESIQQCITTSISPISENIGKLDGVINALNELCARKKCSRLNSLCEFEFELIDGNEYIARQSMMRKIIPSPYVKTNFFNFIMDC